MGHAIGRPGAPATHGTCHWEARCASHASLPSPSPHTDTPPPPPAPPAKKRLPPKSPACLLQVRACTTKQTAPGTGMPRSKPTHATSPHMQQAHTCNKPTHATGPHMQQAHTCNKLESTTTEQLAPSPLSGTRTPTHATSH
eukprot:352122-Chlamydomonas_euryale.AAC.1